MYVGSVRGDIGWYLLSGKTRKVCASKSRSKTSEQCCWSGESKVCGRDVKWTRSSEVMDELACVSAGERGLTAADRHTWVCKERNGWSRLSLYECVEAI